MNTFQLRCFLAVAETLNFAQAAALLNVTQPAVTHQIQSLETELNIKLFRRTTRIVELTHAGQVFLNDAQSIVAISERARQRFENPPDQESQVFSLGCRTHGELFLLAEPLRRMGDIYPNIHPRFQVVPFKHLYRLLTEGDVEVVISFREGIAANMQIRYQELGQIPVVGYCAADHPLAGRPCLTRQDLLQEKLILHDPKKSPDSINALQISLMENHPSSQLFFCDSEEAAITLAQAHYGIAILPDLLFPTPRLTGIPIDGFQPLSFGLYYQSLSGNPMLKDFVRLTRELLTLPAETKTIPD